MEKEDEMKNFMLSLASIVVSILVTIIVMIKGWGLEPKSWFWIVGFYLIGQIFAVSFLVAKEND